MKAASFGRRRRARNAGGPSFSKPPREAVPCQVLADMRRRLALALKPKPAETCDYTDLAALRRDLEARIARHTRECKACAAVRGPLDVFA